MYPDETSVQFSQNSTSASVIPSMVERWCMDSEPIEGGVAEMYAIYGAVAPVRSKAVLKTDKISAGGHQKASVGSLQVLG